MSNGVRFDLKVLRTFFSEPAIMWSADELAITHIAGKRKVYRALDRLVDSGFLLKFGNHGARYAINADILDKVRASRGTLEKISERRKLYGIAEK